MKFFVAFAALVAVTVAVPVSKPVTSDLALVDSIVAAINSPSTDPATAALLEEQLAGIIAALHPVDVGPAIIPEEIVAEPEPISIGPALVPPKPDGGAVVGPVVPSPVVVGDIPAGTSPLVQIIVNVVKAALEAVPVKPVNRPEPVPVFKPVLDGRPEPIATIPIAPEPVQVVEVAPEPVQVVEVAPEPVQISIPVLPVPVEPVQIGIPVLPEAAVVLPEQLN
ncbi:hypothetical protein PYW08_005770 [Mythimna loreyi]|uniref:Uncharacterized protein n=1 Tax=Mythimna loreyi TaxID=667449 RepID=A0ACC2QIQ2_9NEOP|nr:hypothetical protein PYW08_005770 [Mythimna loreyi]